MKIQLLNQKTTHDWKPKMNYIRFLGNWRLIQYHSCIHSIDYPEWMFCLPFLQSPLRFLPTRPDRAYAFNYRQVCIYRERSALLEKISTWDRCRKFEIVNVTKKGLINKNAEVIRNSKVKRNSQGMQYFGCLLYFFVAEVTLLFIFIQLI